VSIANLVNQTSRARSKLEQSGDRNHSEALNSLGLKIQREPPRKVTLTVGSRELQRIVATDVVEDLVATGQ
jgi:hypothetical protein